MVGCFFLKVYVLCFWMKFPEIFLVIVPHFISVLIRKILPLSVWFLWRATMLFLPLGCFLVSKTIDILLSVILGFIYCVLSVSGFLNREYSVALSALNVLFAVAINNESLCRSTVEVLLLFWQLGLASAPSFYEGLSCQDILWILIMLILLPVWLC